MGWQLGPDRTVPVLRWQITRALAAFPQSVIRDLFSLTYQQNFILNLQCPPKGVQQPVEQILRQRKRQQT